MQPEETLQMSDAWIDDAEELLKAADWSKRPQFRTLQTIILMCGYQTLNEFREGSGGMNPAAFPASYIILTLCQSLGSVQPYV